MIKTTSGPIAVDRLKSFIERIENVRGERKARLEDEREIFAEAKGVGFDPPTMRWLLKEREVEVSDRDARDDLRDTYALALSMAVNLVRVDGLSLREAERATGASKSSIQRALAVPEVSQPAPPVPAEGIGHNSKRACISPRPDTWKEITAARDAFEAERQAAKEAERARRRAEREAFAAKNAAIDADPLTLPPDLAAKRREIDARRAAT